MRVLLTNDDGIGAEGLHALRRALRELDGVEVYVIAPDSNRSATARSITTRSPLWVEEVEFDDGDTGFATEGTPVDCVRFADLGLLGEARPDRLGDQPRIQPRRRRHLLGHGGGGVRGDRARDARDRDLAAVPKRGDGLQARARVRLRPRRRSPPSWSSDRRRSAPRARCSTSTAPRRGPKGSRSPGSASASTTTS